MFKNNKNYTLAYILALVPLVYTVHAQTTSAFDDFEGNGTVVNWYGDDCGIHTQWANPFPVGINNSATVLKYDDTGGFYANVRCEVLQNFDLNTHGVFTIKIYVSSASITGQLPLQISLKLQNGNLAEPWTTQSEIIKPLVLDQWQEIEFNFHTDNYINLNPQSLPPTERTDFNRLVWQINGEANTDKVVAYLDDMSQKRFEDTMTQDPSFDLLVWHDEFDEDGPIQSSHWHHQTLLPNGDSWYNGEIQHYTDRLSNSYCADGYLHIVAKKESYTHQNVAKDYTSARLNSTFAFTYGKVEMRAKLPSGVGTWPAFWMLGKNIIETGAYWTLQGHGTTYWPTCGEIDIMEHWGHNQNFVQSAIHTPSSFGNTVNLGGTFVPTVSTDFHIYTLIWTDQKLEFRIDNTLYYTYQPDIKNGDTWPFDSDMFILLNTAILPSIVPGFTESPFVIDYVRVYQQSPSNTAPDHNIYDPFTIYPNPTDNTLNIFFSDFPLDQSPVVVNILNNNGHILYSTQIVIIDNTATIQDITFLTSGMYWLSIEDRCIPFIKQ